MTHIALKSVVTAMLAAGLCLSAPLGAHDDQDSEQASHAADAAFDQLTQLAGAWDVEGRERLTIVFELTAGDSVLIERWMVGERMHSMTVYQRDAGGLLATHYCPQGNAPNLASQGDDLDGLHFRFRDAHGLDRENEEWVHDLWIRIEDGQVLRGETYRDAQEIGEESVLRLSRQG